MNDYVVDACSLIYLTKIELKEEFLKLGQVYISQGVNSELLQDIDRFEDAKIIKRNIDRKKISLKILNDKTEQQNINLGVGEIETIRIAKKFNIIPITDDLQGINYGKTLGLKPLTSELILLKLLKKKLIDIEEFKNKFNKLAIIKSLSLDIVNFFIEQANKISQ
jgi:hypothetical protein